MGGKRKATHVLRLVEERLGCELRISKRGVPHLVFPGGYSACYFGRTDIIRVFSGYASQDNGKYADFPDVDALVSHFRDILGFKDSGLAKGCPDGAREGTCQDSPKA